MFVERVDHLAQAFQACDSYGQAIAYAPSVAYQYPDESSDHAGDLEWVILFNGFND